MILVTIYILLAAIVLCRSDNVDVGGWAPVRGSIWGVLNDVKCPDNGMITGIRYTSTNINNIMNRLGFYCTSSKGETLVGPFGGANDGTCINDKCPQGMFVRSIYGRGAAAIDAFGINCGKLQGNDKVQLSLHGGSGGAAYDDDGFVTSGRKLAAIRVWTYPEVIAGIQVQYMYAPEETWAPLHGSINDLQCPNDGVVTGIRYKSTNFINRLGIYCLSSNGETLIGPFGGANDNYNSCVDDKCPQGMYIKSIYGRGAAAMDAFGINCVKYEGGDKVQLPLHGGNGGAAYDGDSWGMNGRKPNVLRVWSNNDLIVGVQIRYLK